MSKLQYTGAVKDGKLTLTAPILFQNEIHVFNGKEVRLTIERESRKRSYLQNAYYWSVLIEIIYATFKDFGEEVTRIRTHEMLKAKFLERHIVSKKGEIIGTYAGSTTDLTTLQFNDEYVEPICRWFVQTFGISIPVPDRDKVHQQIEAERVAEERKQARSEKQLQTA